MTRCAQIVPALRGDDQQEGFVETGFRNDLATIYTCNIFGIIRAKRALVIQADNFVALHETAVCHSCVGMRGDIHVSFRVSKKGCGNASAQPPHLRTPLSCREAGWWRLRMRPEGKYTYQGCRGTFGGRYTECLPISSRTFGRVPCNM